jgi:hypothetical protein
LEWWVRVERSPYERANGYSYEAVKIFMPAGSKQPVVVHYTEHCPPDVGAASIWLKNRDPERWRDTQNVEHVLGEYIISDRPMTEQEWAAERANRADTVKRRKWRSLWLLIYRRTFLSEPAAKHAAAIAFDWFEKQGN